MVKSNKFLTVPLVAVLSLSLLTSCGGGGTGGGQTTPTESTSSAQSPEASGGEKVNNGEGSTALTELRNVQNKLNELAKFTPAQASDYGVAQQKVGEVYTAYQSFRDQLPDTIKTQIDFPKVDAEIDKIFQPDSNYQTILADLAAKKYEAAQTSLSQIKINNESLFPSDKIDGQDGTRNRTAAKKLLTLIVDQTDKHLTPLSNSITQLSPETPSQNSATPAPSPKAPASPTPTTEATASPTPTSTSSPGSNNWIWFLLLNYSLIALGVLSYFYLWNRISDVIITIKKNDIKAINTRLSNIQSSLPTRDHSNNTTLLNQILDNISIIKEQQLKQSSSSTSSPELPILQQENQRLKSENQRLTSDRNRFRDELAAKDRQIQQLSSGDIYTIRQHHQELQEKYHKLRQEKDTLSQHQGSVAQENDSLKQRIQQLEGQLNQVQTELENSNQINQALNREKETLQQEKAELEQTKERYFEAATRQPLQLTEVPPQWQDLIKAYRHNPQSIFNHGDFQGKFIEDEQKGQERYEDTTKPVILKANQPGEYYIVSLTTGQGQHHLLFPKNPAIPASQKFTASGLFEGYKSGNTNPFTLTMPAQVTPLGNGMWQVQRKGRLEYDGQEKDKNRVNKLQFAYQNLSQEKEKLEAEKEKLQKENTSAKQRMQDFQAELQQLRSQNNNLRQTLEQQNLTPTVSQPSATTPSPSILSTWLTLISTYQQDAKTILKYANLEAETIEDDEQFFQRRSQPNQPAILKPTSQGEYLVVSCEIETETTYLLFPKEHAIPASQGSTAGALFEGYQRGNTKTFTLIMPAQVSPTENGMWQLENKGIIEYI